MDSADLVRAIGVSHLLQPPLTLLLASPKCLDLRRALTARTEIAVGVLHNLAVAGIALPTALGLLLAFHAEQALADGPARAYAWLLSGFWCWRLYRQVRLHASWPRDRHVWSFSLFFVFFTQGPGLALTLLGADTIDHETAIPFKATGKHACTGTTSDPP